MRISDLSSDLCSSDLLIVYCKWFFGRRFVGVVEMRSGCPINLTLEVLGDRWSLIILRDMMFGNRRHFRELLNRSEEGIASNILADRLKRLTRDGLLTRADDPSHKQKAIYSLTEKAIQLLPLFVVMGACDRKSVVQGKSVSVRVDLGGRR